MFNVWVPSSCLPIQRIERAGDGELHGDAAAVVAHVEGAVDPDLDVVEVLGELRCALGVAVLLEVEGVHQVVGVILGRGDQAEVLGRVEVDGHAAVDDHGDFADVAEVKLGLGVEVAVERRSRIARDVGVGDHGVERELDGEVADGLAALHVDVDRRVGRVDHDAEGHGGLVQAHADVAQAGGAGAGGADVAAGAEVDVRDGRVRRGLVERRVEGVSADELRVLPRAIPNDADGDVTPPMLDKVEVR